MQGAELRADAELKPLDVFQRASFPARVGMWSCDRDLQDAQHMLVNPGALAFTAAGHIQNSIERLQGRAQEFRISFRVRKVVKPDVPFPQPLALVQGEPAAGAQGRSCENHGTVGLLYVLDGARLIRVLRVFLQLVTGGHNTIFSAATLGAPAANWDAVGETKIQPGPIGPRLAARDDFADVQAMGDSPVWRITL